MFKGRLAESEQRIRAVRAKRGVAVFLAVAFGSSWTLWWIGWWLPEWASLSVWLPLFGPALGAVCAWLVQQRGHGLGLRAPSVRQLGLAYLLPLLALLVAYALSIVAGLQAPLADPGAAQQSLRPWVGLAPPEAAVPVAFALALTVHVLLLAILSLGEELGWRGYLLPSLQGLGQGKAILLSGLVWGIWHWPLVGLAYPANPALGLCMIVAATLAWSPLLSWHYLRSGSVLAPAVGHGVLNALGWPMRLALTAGDPLLIPPVGLTAILPAASLGLWLMLRRPPRTVGENAA